MGIGGGSEEAVAVGGTSIYGLFVLDVLMASK